MRALRTAAPLLLAALLGGCGQDMGDLEAYALEVKARTSRNIDPIPQVKAFEPFLYEAHDRRDPFTPLLQSRDEQLAGGPGGNGLVRPDFNRPREPLEEFTLDSLRMVGTIAMQGKTFALVRAPDGVVHRVTSGDHMGQNYGKITAITETEMTMVEIIQDGFGGWIQRPATVALVQ